MFRMGSFKGTLAGVKKYFFSSCDAEPEDDFDTPSLIEQVRIYCTVLQCCFGGAQAVLVVVVG